MKMYTSTCLLNRKIIYHQSPEVGSLVLLVVPEILEEAGNLVLFALSASDVAFYSAAEDNLRGPPANPGGGPNPAGYYGLAHKSDSNHCNISTYAVHQVGHLYLESQAVLLLEILLEEIH